MSACGEGSYTVTWKICDRSFFNASGDAVMARIDLVSGEAADIHSDIGKRYRLGGSILRPRGRFHQGLEVPIYYGKL
jgi:hypothetical protein